MTKLHFRAFAFLLTSFLTSHLPCQAALSHALPDIVDKLDARQAGWTALKAKVTLSFLASNGEQTSCYGTLAYERLEERILLQCYGRQATLYFIFKTADRTFELYLPPSKILYRGNIFQLENSFEIESQLHPLDLYRALKLMAIPQERAKVSEWSENAATLEVLGKRAGKDYLARKIRVLETGDVPLEIFYNPAGKPVTAIKREDLKELQNPTGRKRKFVFPHRITIENKRENVTLQLTQTTFSFGSIEFMPSLDPAEWGYVLPDDTQIVTLKEPETVR